MNVLLPVFITHSNFWNNAENHELVRVLFSNIGPVSKDDRHIVITDSMAISQLARQMGWEVIEAQFPICNDEVCCSEPVVHSGSALKILSKTNVYFGPTLVADFRNPFLDAAMIAEAKDVYGDCNGYLVSVILPEDHPCQFNLHLRLLDFGVLLAPDQNEQKGVSLPFGWNWDWFDLSGDPVDFKFNNQTKVLQPAGLDRPFMYREGRRRARGYVEAHSESLTHYPPRAKNAGNVQMIHSIKKSHFKIECPLAGHDTELLRIIPFNSDGLMEEAYQEIAFDRSSETCVTNLPEELSGLLFFRFALIQEGEVDYIEPFVPPNAPWCIIPDKPTRKINLESGNEIYGRQEFPEVFQPDGTLCIVPDPVNSMVNLAMAQPFILNGRSLIIRDIVDLLQYQICHEEGHDCRY